MPEYYEYEVTKAAHRLATEMFKLKPGETFVITADTESDPRVVDATAAAAFSAGAKPMVIWLASPLGVGKDADPMLPVKALTAVLKEADAWVEFNNQWLLYSTPYEIAAKENKKLRYLCLVGMNVDMMTRTIGRVDTAALKAFEDKLVGMTKDAKHVRMTTPAGEHVEFDNDPKRPINLEVGYANSPGTYMLGGQISWSPVFDSINGVIVFDGSIVPPIGLVKEPVELYVENGEIVKIKGGKDATTYEAWLKGFKHPRMLKMAHVCYSCNPGAKLTGDILEDERVWGATEWGVGYVGPALTGGEPISAPSHSDGICLNTSVWLDEGQIWNKGRVVHPELAELAKKLGKA